jgi:hypothetical protein
LDVCIQKILAHPVFQDILLADPLPIDGNAEAGESGHMMEFNAEHCQTALKNAGEYTCACNVWWADPRYTATPGVPYNMKAITELKNAYFSTPTRMTMPVEIALETLDQSVLNHKGGLLRVSPEEYIHALFSRVADLVDSGEGHADLRKWRAVMLTTPFHFTVVGTERDRFWKAVNLREQAVSSYEAVARSPIQRVFEIISFKNQREKAIGPLTVAQLAKEYETNARLAASTEPVAFSFIETAMYCWTGVLSKADMLALVLATEDHFGKRSPWDSLYKLSGVISKARTERNIAWILGSIHDLCLRDVITPRSLTVRNLTGKDLPGNLL